MIVFEELQICYSILVNYIGQQFSNDKFLTKKNKHKIQAILIPDISMFH